MSKFSITRHQARGNRIPRFAPSGRTIAAPLLLGILLVTVGCNNTTTTPLNPADTTTGTSAPAPAAPQPATVTERDIVGQVVLGGQIIVPPSAHADLNPPFRATVNKVNKSVGAAVTKGDVLVELAMPSAEAYHEQTKQALQEAETAYANAQKQFQAPVDAAQKQLEAARAAAKNAATGDTGSATSDPAAGDANQANNDRVTAEQALLQARADMAEQLLPYKQQLEQVREANLQARAGEKQGYIRTPLTGTVTVLNAQPGKEVSPDIKAPVATVVDLNALQVQSSMTPQQAGYVKPGMEVALTFDEVPEKTFTGNVSRMTSQPNNRGFVAIIAFRNTELKARPGMKPHVAIKTGKSVKNALAVPSAAVRVDSSGKPIVSVMRDGKWQSVVVEAGISDTQFTEIKTGLKKDETVQVSP